MPPRQKKDSSGVLDALAPDSKKSRTHRRGFGSMTKEKVRELGSKGGKKAHKRKKAHCYTSAEASAAGKKSAEVRARKKIEAMRAASLRSAEAQEKPETATVVSGPHEECALHGKFFGDECLECLEGEG